MQEIKIKVNVNLIKWCLTIFILTFNISLLGIGRNEDETLFIIIFEVSINCLAILNFVLLSIFPRFYYVINNNGVSFQNRKGREISYVSWNYVKKLHYEYVLFVPQGVMFEFVEGYQNKQVGMSISKKQARMLYENLPSIRPLFDKEK